MPTKFYVHRNPWLNFKEPVVVTGISELPRTSCDVSTVTLAVDASHMNYNGSRYSAIAVVCEELGLEAHAIVGTSMQSNAEIAGIYLAFEIISHIIAIHAPSVTTVVIVTDQTFVASLWGKKSIATRKNNQEIPITMLRDKRRYIADTLPYMNVLIADTFSHSRYEHSGHEKADALAGMRLGAYIAGLKQEDKDSASRLRVTQSQRDISKAAGPPYINALAVATPQHDGDAIQVTCHLSNGSRVNHTVQVSTNEARNLIQALSYVKGPLNPSSGISARDRLLRAREFSPTFARVVGESEIKMPIYALDLVINQLNRHVLAVI